MIQHRGALCRVSAARVPYETRGSPCVPAVLAPKEREAGRGTQAPTYIRTDCAKLTDGLSTAAHRSGHVNERKSYGGRSKLHTPERHVPRTIVARA